MGVGAALRAFAYAEPTAFPVIGFGGESAWRDYLRGNPVLPTGAPHDADLLVLAGEIPAGWSEALQALFETLALPRAALWLPPYWPCAAPDAVPLTDDPHRALLDRQALGNQPLLEDRPPSPWRGRGDHGQGGEGMMGGKPYGRSMAMTGPDPDGLMLDAVPTSLGPFFPGLPSGLQLELTMQGDRISSVDAVRNWFPERGTDEAGVAPELAPAMRVARGEEIRVVELETARLRSHLAWATSFLEVAGLEALSRRFLRLLDPRRVVDLEDLFGAAERRQLRRVCEGLGHIGLDVAHDLCLAGPVMRASGRTTDARAGASGYPAFEVQVAYGGDAWARWQVRRNECLQSARLIETAGPRLTTAAEAPRGAISMTPEMVCTPSRTNLAALEHVLPGLLWSEAVLVIASLDLDMAEAALR
jgi:Ni,Fe-hydrogenase III large subunit